ncbi:free fatty acid receptor 2-like [Eublepharis macularius]|uniref:Free fatty acid receptor 2-like n=1 Tax=Eublepharis macularius TaxID=481883 RepID=A0AA97LGK7_EUBMA|nr:free fatty acid receptor 2-like [Eublepharis macularius]XP_054855319.1 free fatty acid receptor 2-like [Eublepharis macularius]
MANRAVILAVYIITFLIGLPANLLSLYTFLMKGRKEPVPIDTLLLNLALSDFIFLVFLPFKMSEAAQTIDWPFPEVFCDISTCIFLSSIYASVLFLTAISVNRFLSVAFPIKYKMKRKPAYAVVASVFIWLLVFSHCSTIFVIRSMNTNTNETFQLPSNRVVCYKEFNEKQKKIVYPFQLELCLALFCLPFIIAVFCYIKVFRILASLSNVQARRKQHCMGLALVTFLIFAICYGPFNVSHIFGAINYADVEWRDYSLALSSFSVCLDPFVFFFSSNPIRKNAGIWYRRLQRIILQCSVPCNKDYKEGAVSLSPSNGLAETGVATESSFGHAAKEREQ